MGMDTCQECRESFIDWYRKCPYCRAKLHKIPQSVEEAVVVGTLALGTLVMVAGIVWCAKALYSVLTQ